MTTSILHVGGLFDGTRLHGPSIVTVQNKRIASVEDLTPDAPAATTDFGRESFLMPGLIDTHVHLALDAGDDPPASLATEDESTTIARMAKSARKALIAGVTTIRDVGDKNFLSLRTAEGCRRHPANGPHIVTSGPPLTSPGGHCHFLGGEVAGVDDLRAAVRERHRRGCQVVKIMVSGGHITRGSSPYVTQFSRAEVTAVVDEARSLGMTVAAHAHHPTAIEYALSAGVTSLEHATFMVPGGFHVPDALVDRIIEGGVFVSATLGRDPDADDALGSTWPAIDEIYRELHWRGVRIVAGTDAGINPAKRHDVLPYAVAELGGIGMSPVEALSAVTRHAAELCGLAGSKGVVRAGADADLLVLGADPTADLTRVRDVVAVYRAGYRVR